MTSSITEARLGTYRAHLDAAAAVALDADASRHALSPSRITNPLHAH